MKVILLQDVKSQGKKDDVIEVNDGYARNFLFPRKLAIEANKSNMNELGNRKAAENFKAEQELKKAKEQGEILSGKTVTIYQKTGAGDKLFGSVTSKDVSEALTMQHHIKIDKKKFVMPDGIKTLGTTVVDIKVHAGVTAKLKVEVTEL